MARKSEKVVSLRGSYQFRQLGDRRTVAIWSFPRWPWPAKRSIERPRFALEFRRPVEKLDFDPNGSLKKPPTVRYKNQLVTFIALTEDATRALASILNSVFQNSDENAPCLKK